MPYQALLKRTVPALCAIALLLCSLAAHAAAKPLKVYILVGQSNMEGHATIQTIDYIGEDNKTKHLHKLMVGKGGKPVTAERVWVSNQTGFFDNNGVTTGKLTAGFGARRNPNELGDKIGPEYTFGLTMQEAYDGPILIIKCAWGGKSLHIDFRPPSAGPYQLNEGEIEKLKKQNKNIKQISEEKAQASGHYYRLMTEHVNKVLADPGQVVPNYDPKAGFEIAGFVWFQGWNDMVFSNVYPERSKPGGYDDYSKWLAMFIKDVRKEFNAPDMPFVIGVMGVGGPIAEDARNKTQLYFRQAMAAPAKQMKNVIAVETAPYWDMKLDAIATKRSQVSNMSRLLRNKHKSTPNADGKMTKQEQQAYMKKYEADLISPEEQALWERGASNAGYHYLGCGKTMAQIGEAFANALLKK